MEKRLGETEMPFYRRRLSIREGKNEVFREKENKKESYTYYKSETVEVSRAYDKERGRGKSDTHRIECRQESSRKQRITYLASLTKCLMGQGLGEIPRRQKYLIATKYRKVWRTIIPYVLS